MNVYTSKTLGGVGALLMLISPFSGFIGGAFTGVLGLVGLILVLIALKGFSDHYGEGGIFNNGLYGIIMVIIGGVAMVAVLLVTAVSFLAAIGIEASTLFTDPNALQNIDWQSVVTLDIIWPHLAGFFGSLVIFFVFSVIAAILIRKSLSTLSEKTGVGLFGTTGLLILIGAVLTIIGIGFILLWIAMILLTIAFFSVRTGSSQPTEE